MRQSLLLFAALIVAFFVSTCSGLDRTVVANAFEQRVPIYKCPAQVPVNDPDPVQLIDFDLDQDSEITFLTPQVRLGSRHLKSKDDSIYFDRMRTLITSRIENKFLQEEWVSSIEPFSFPQLIDSETGNNVLWDEMTVRVRNKMTIDYGLWRVAKQLLDKDEPGYTALLLIDGQIGYDRDNQNNNLLYFYIMDNEAQKVVYADYLNYTCDIRNSDALDRVLNYTYVKFFSARFPEFVDREGTPK